MLSLRRPTAEKIQAFLAVQTKLELTYSGVGTSATTPPPGYVVDHTRIKLGEGAKVFSSARVALEKWMQFRPGWVEEWPTETPIKVGQVVAVIARLFGLWMLNACRIVYLVEEQHKFGFAYGTLPDHAESGEERFTVEWDRTDESVWYDILAFSRPRHFLARLGYPFVRKLQKRFARDSVAAMVRAVTNGSA